jgi:23S rRNA (uracil1939-C5)-methyltransferase
MEIKIEKLVYGGKGIGRVDNKVYFVPFVLPDELVEIKTTKEKKNFAEAVPLKIIKQNPERIEPKCKYFSICGGCDYQHTDYKNQLKIKKEIFKELLERIGKIYIEQVDIIPSKNEFFYRNRVQFKIQGNKVGFYKKESNQVVDIDKCILLKENLSDLPLKIKNILLKMKFQPLEMHFFTNSKNEVLMKIVFPKKIKEFPFDLKHIKNILKIDIVGIGLYFKNKKGVLNRFKLFGKDFLIEDVVNYRYRISMDSFFQVNIFQLENLINLIENALKGKKFRKIADLYCGVGLLTFPASKFCESCIGIEVNKHAIKDAEYNKKLNKIGKINFYNLDIKDSINLINKENPEVIIVDPPRTGLDKNFLKNIKNFKNLKEIIYISCNPSTLARDLKKLEESGFKIENIKLIDMFPETYHIESFTVLKRAV